MKKNLITLTAVLVITCSMAWAAVPSYPVLFQGDGTALDVPVNGYAEEIVDISGNGNNLIATSPVGVPNDATGHHLLTDDGPAGVGDAYTRTHNGGNTNVEAPAAVQTPEFYWEADVRFEPDALNAGQGGLFSANTYIFGGRGNEHGEGITLRALPSGALEAYTYVQGGNVTATTASGLVADNTWVNVGVSFEDVTDGGLFPYYDWAPENWISTGRQLYAGTLKIYIDGVEEASEENALMALNDDGFAFVLANWGTDIGITPNLGFDNILVTGKDVFVPGLLEGDANDDGIVSSADYLAIQSAFGDTGYAGLPFYGDANHDGVVDADDFAAVRANYGAVTPTAPEDSQSIPEPMTLSLLAIGGIALIRRKGRNALLILTIVFAMSGVAVAQSYEIPTGTAVIDADLSDWAGANWFTIDTNPSGVPSDITNTQMAVKWDTNNIYMAVKYDDADLQLAQNLIAWNGQDNIEVYINANNDNAVSYGSSGWTTAQHYFVGAKGSNPGGLSGTAASPAGFWSNLGSVHELPSVGYPNAVIYTATSVVGSSLIYEMRIPAFSDMGNNTMQSLSLGDVVGVDLYLNDRSASNFTYLTMNSNGGKSGDAGQFQDWTLVSGYSGVHYTLEETASGTWDVKVDVTGDSAGLAGYAIWVDDAAEGTSSYTENTLGTTKGFLPANLLQGDIEGGFNFGNQQGIGADAIAGIGVTAVAEDGVTLDAQALLGTLTTLAGLGEDDFSATMIALLNAAGDDYLDVRGIAPTLEVIPLGAVLLAGDANRDGQVSAGDYASVQANFGNTGAPNDPLLFGDANLDGQVSAGDYASVQANFGNTLGAAVPEPMTMSILALGGLAVLRRRKK